MSDDRASGASARDVINRMALEDRDERYMLEHVAPLVSKLKPGINFVNNEVFIDLIRWFKDYIDDPIDVIYARGRFGVYEQFEIVRVQPVPWMTLAELARKTGIPRYTLDYQIKKLSIESRLDGKRKLYNINSLAPLLGKITKSREE